MAEDGLRYQDKLDGRIMQAVGQDIVTLGFKDTRIIVAAALNVWIAGLHTAYPDDHLMIQYSVIDQVWYITKIEGVFAEFIHFKLNDALGSGSEFANAVIELTYGDGLGIREGRIGQGVPVWNPPAGCTGTPYRFHGPAGCRGQAILATFDQKVKGSDQRPKYWIWQLDCPAT